MRFLLVVLAVCLVGCGNQTTTTPPIYNGPIIEKPETPRAVKVAAAQKALDAAIVSGDPAARLTAERDLLYQQQLQAEETVKALKAQIESKDKEIIAAEIEAKQFKLRLFAYSMFGLALLLVGLAIWIPATARHAIKAALAAICVASLSLVFAWLLPYLFVVGCVLALLILIAGIAYWRMDHRTATQVVEAVQTVKHEIPDYKVKLGNIIDSDVDSWITGIRTRLASKSAGQAATKPADRTVEAVKAAVAEVDAK